MTRHLYVKWATCFAAIALLLSSSGCDSEEKKTLLGANERISALERDNKHLLAEVARKEAELVAGKTTLSADFDKQLTTVKELNRQRVADLEGQVASLQIQLGSVSRERLTLQEIVDLKEHGPQMMQASMNRERLVWATCVFACVIPLLWVTTRFAAMKRSLNPYLLRRAAAAQSLVESP